MCDLDPRAPHDKTVLGLSVVVWYDRGAGEGHVFDDACPHRLAPLSKGRIDRVVVVVGRGGSGEAQTGWCGKGAVGRAELIDGSLSFKRAQANLGLGLGRGRGSRVAAAGDVFIPTSVVQPPPSAREAARARFADLSLDSAAAERSKHEAAALKLQKVYKSFRTRRQLADCAVLVEQSWTVFLCSAPLFVSSSVVTGHLNNNFRRAIYSGAFVVHTKLQV